MWPSHIQGQPGALLPQHIKALFIDVDLKKNTVWSFRADREATIFLYILEGDGEFGRSGKSVGRRNAILLDQGDEIEIRAGAEGLRFVLCQAHPIARTGGLGRPHRHEYQRGIEQSL